MALQRHTVAEGIRIREFANVAESSPEVPCIKVRDRIKAKTSLTEIVSVPPLCIWNGRGVVVHM